jgi:tripeptidyl-peptidase I
LYNKQGEIHPIKHQSIGIVSLLHHYINQLSSSRIEAMPRSPTVATTTTSMPLLLVALLAMAVVVAMVPVVNGDRVHLEPPVTADQTRHWTIETRDSRQTDWTLSQHTTMVRLYIALKLRNGHSLEHTFWQVSDPSSDRYGHHLSRSALSSLVAPSHSSIAAVCQWLASHNISTSMSSSSRSGLCGTSSWRPFTNDWIVVDCSVAQASQLLHTSFARFQHRLDASWHIIRARSYSVPRHLARHIAFIGGVQHFPCRAAGSIQLQVERSRRNRLKLLHQVRHTSDGAQATRRGVDIADATPPSNQIVTPAVLRQHYNITLAQGTMPNNSQAVHEFEQQYYSASDLAMFFARNNLPNASVAVQIGYNNVSHPGGEAELDLQYIMGVGVNVPTWFVYVPGTNRHNQEEPFLEWILLMLSIHNAPLVNSISYGEDERSYSGAYLTRVAQEFQKWGTLGHSLLFSSGDYGVGCDCSQPNQTQYVAHFPSSSPYVTSVGATTAAYDVHGNPTNVEVGISFSGGGFSTHFARPSYQDALVSQFLSTPPLPPASFFNASNRGYPDVCAYGWNYEIIENGIDTSTHPPMSLLACSNQDRQIDRLIQRQRERERESNCSCLVGW